MRAPADACNNPRLSLHRIGSGPDHLSIFDLREGGILADKSRDGNPRNAVLGQVVQIAAKPCEIDLEIASSKRCWCKGDNASQFLFQFCGIIHRLLLLTLCSLGSDAHRPNPPHMQVRPERVKPERLRFKATHVRTPSIVKDLS